MNPWSLAYWQSGEYQAAREKLDDDERLGFRINPTRKDLFKALALVPEKSVRVCIIGQDPYPNHHHSTGIAFSIPEDVATEAFPPTLRIILDEYVSDLRHPMPSHGDLTKWCHEGVLLWNAIPSCREGQSLSHDWKGEEWSPLTTEIITRLSPKGIVFVFLGSVARRYAPLVTAPSVAFSFSHPSPRGNRNSKVPFTGSRLFTTVNSRLIELGLPPVDWRLDGSSSQSVISRSVVAGSQVLPNITRAELPGLKRKAGPNLASSTFTL